VILPGEEVETLIKSDLDTRSGAVSGDAFERHGTIESTTPGVLGFGIGVTVEETNPGVSLIAPSNCPICSNQRIESLFEYVKNRPFSSLGTHTIPATDTHDETPCNGCRKTGEIFCRKCSGNGQVVCSECDGSGSQRIRRDCENCGGEEPYLRECVRCDETGKVWDTEPCSECQGQRKLTCPSCTGDGKVVCKNCDGSGFRHRYEVTEFSLNRDIQANTLPDSWTDDHHSVGKKLPWETDQLIFDTANSNEIYIQTDTLNTVYITVEYGEDSYNAAIVEWLEDNRVIWDPKIEFPQTSIRRKLGDIKSRLLW
jgi:hypothetical protein